MRNLLVLIQPLSTVQSYHPPPRPIEENKIGKQEKLEMTNAFAMNELIRDLKPTLLATLFSWKLFFGLDCIFASFPQKRNSTAFSLWVNYLHSGGNIQSE